MKKHKSNPDNAPEDEPRPLDSGAGRPRITLSTNPGGLTVTGPDATPTPKEIDDAEDA